ncbi:hypothetical protein K440DRAFT_659810 [Wilcoxina mikolae CBS 423.85]|nr:hypothetical protein K440DRAFT_659810 [Wilcoxina mikolae CBS 423.85]
MRSTTPNTPHTADTILDTPSSLILFLAAPHFSTTPTPLKRSFLTQQQHRPAVYEPANPYRDLVATTPIPAGPNRFAPPRFSSRLRELVQTRFGAPLRIHLVPPPMSEKARLQLQRPLPPPPPQQQQQRRSASERAWLYLLLVGAVGLLVGAAVLGVEGLRGMV